MTLKIIYTALQKLQKLYVYIRIKKDPFWYVLYMCETCAVNAVMAGQAGFSFCNRSADGSIAHLLHMYTRRENSISFTLPTDYIFNNIKIIAPFHGEI